MNSNIDVKLFWSLFGLLFVLVEGDRSSVTVDIYWNKSNEIFQTTNNDHILELALKDKIRFHCPHYDDNWANSPKEYYIIYRVPQEYFDSCSLPLAVEERDFHRFNIRRVTTCSNPDSMRHFSTVLEQFSPLPGTHGGLTFQPGESYYFISVSSGTLEGLGNRDALYSSCLNDNMKLKLNVCCPPDQDSSESPVRHYPTMPARTTLPSRRRSSTRRKPGTDSRNSQRMPSTADPISSKTTEFTIPESPQAIINAEVILDSSATPGYYSALTITLSLLSTMYHFIIQ